MTIEKFIQSLAVVQMSFFITKDGVIRTKEFGRVVYGDSEVSYRCLCPIEALWYHMTGEYEGLCYADAAEKLGIDRLDMWRIVSSADNSMIADDSLRQSLLSTLNIEEES